MPLVTPLTISDAVPIPLTTGGGPDGNAEKAAGEAFVREAVSYLRRALGAARVEEITAWETATDPEEKRAYASLSQAASLLAYAAAMPGLGLRSLPQGGLMTSSGYEANRVELLSISDINKYQAELRMRAGLLIADFPPPTPREIGYATIRSLR